MSDTMKESQISSKNPYKILEIKNDSNKHYVKREDGVLEIKSYRQLDYLKQLDKVSQLVDDSTMEEVMKLVVFYGKLMDKDI